MVVWFHCTSTSDSFDNFVRLLFGHGNYSPQSLHEMDHIGNAQTWFSVFPERLFNLLHYEIDFLVEIVFRKTIEYVVIATRGKMLETR